MTVTDHMEMDFLINISDLLSKGDESKQPSKITVLPRTDYFTNKDKGKMSDAQVV